MKINSFKTFVSILKSKIKVRIRLIERNRYLTEEMPKYYAVANGRHNGIYNSWDDCKEQVNGYSGAKYKSFGTAEEAQHFINGYNYGRQESYESSETRFNSNTNYYSNNSSDSSVDTMTPIVYTDGACSRNGFKGAIGGIGVYWGDGHIDNVCEPLYGRQTNNRAEIKAAITAIERAKQRGYKRLRLRTDSSFLQQSVNDWMHKWKQNGWKKSDGTPVVNKDDFIELDTALKGIEEKVAAHRGIHGNEEADRLANEGMNKR